MASGIAVYLSPPPADYCLLLISHICLNLLKIQIPSISDFSLLGLKLSQTLYLLYVCTDRHLHEVER